jgi:glycosyltransferase involved in cell wall biosynthesis
VVTLTEAIWPVIREWEGLRGRNVPHQVIPCCTDLQRFRFDPAARARRRAELNLDDNFVLVYSGSIGSWYLTDLMADFFLELLKQRPGAHFLWLTPGSHAAIKLLMQERGIKASQFTVRSVESAEVASYLSASDAGVAFYKPGFSKLATSPVKIAEYLACGLPIIINAGIGDSDALATREQAGALVSDFTPQEYVQAVTTVLGMRGDIEALRCRTREVAGRLFDLRGVGLERYVRLYEEAYR